VRLYHGHPGYQIWVEDPLSGLAPRNPPVTNTADKRPRLIVKRACDPFLASVEFATLRGTVKRSRHRLAPSEVAMQTVARSRSCRRISHAKSVISHRLMPAY
jgi:hypothetical protein